MCRGWDNRTEQCAHFWWRYVCHCGRAIKGLRLRALIRQDMDLLDRLPAMPPKARQLSAQSMPALTNLIDAADKSHALRKAAMSQMEQLARHRATCLRAVVHRSSGGNVNHGRANWLPDLRPVGSCWRRDCRLRTTRRVTRCHLTHARLAWCRPVASPRRDRQTTALPAPRRRRCPGGR